MPAATHPLERRDDRRGRPIDQKSAPVVGPGARQSPLGEAALRPGVPRIDDIRALLAGCGAGRSWVDVDGKAMYTGAFDEIDHVNDLAVGHHRVGGDDGL